MPVPARILLSLTEEDPYKCCLLRNGYLQFTVNAYYYSNIRIGFFVGDEMSQDKTTGDPEYVIKVASQEIDSKIELFKRGTADSLKRISTPHILALNAWKGFWVSTSNGCITFGKENESEPIIYWKHTNLKPVIKLGFRVDPDDDSTANEEDRFLEEAEVAIDIESKPSSTAVSWISCTYGQLPDNALVGGDHDGNDVYVIRSGIHHDLTPGQLRHRTTYAEVCWSGKVHRMNEYEVLANFDGDWVKRKEDNIPALALEAGRSYDDHPLYIGRTTYNGSLLVGKVEPNYRVLYIPYDGYEVASKEFEILCHKPPGLSTIPHPIDLDEVDKNKQVVEKWIYSCHGRIPRNAFVIGYKDAHSIVLIRAKLFGYWYPGWLCSADVDPKVYAYDYHLKEVEEYEVLCDFKGYWEKPVGLSVLKNALVVEVTDGLDIMYVGRFWHEGELICGPVRYTLPSPTEGKLVCTVFYKNGLITVEDFEILCHPNEVYSATNKYALKNFRWDL